MAQCYKRKGRLSFDSDISSPEGKKICESPRSDPNINTASDEGEDDQVLEALNMAERIASQLELICQTLASVETRLQRLEGIFERFSVLESSINSLQTGLSTLSEKSRILEEKTNYIEKAVEFENAEIEGLKKKDKENEDKIKELEDKLLYQEVYNRITAAWLSLLCGRLGVRAPDRRTEEKYCKWLRFSVIWLAGDVKEPTHSSKRVGHIVWSISLVFLEVNEHLA